MSIATLSTPEQRLAALGLTLPPPPRPVADYVTHVQEGTLLFLSGQGPRDSATGQIVGETIEEQTARTLENVKAILEAGGASLADRPPRGQETSGSAAGRL